MENKTLLRFAGNSEMLYKNFLMELKKGKQHDWYIIDRNKCTNFGLIYRDGVFSYAAIDMFCERLYKRSAVTKLEKEINVLKPEDEKKIDEYNNVMEYIQAATQADVSNIDQEKLDSCNKRAETLQEEIKQIQPTTERRTLPFYVNPVTKDEFPLASLKDASEEELRIWAQKLTAFVESFKMMITPAAFSEYIQPNGLSFMIIKYPMWSDLVIR